MDTQTVSPFTLRDAIECVLGTHMVDVEREFVDLHNDLRVANVWELIDLGIPREKAEIALYLCDAYFCGRDIREAFNEQMEDVAEVA